MPDFDAIIIGAGPAGSATALRAGRAGLRVLLLDAKTFPRDKVCSDSLSSAVMANVRDLGLEDRLLALDHVPVREISFFAPDGVTVTVPVLKLDSQMRAAGMICRRVLFDEMLFEAARELENVTAMTWCRAADILIKDGRACGVTVDRGGGRLETFTAHVLVGADGANSFVARKMNMPLYPEYRIIAAQAYFRQVIGLRGHAEIHFPEETLPGYLWLHPTRTSQTNVGLALPLESWKDKRPRLEKVLEQALASTSLRERFAFAEQMGRTQVRLLPVGNTLREIHGEGFLLVGDAAGLATPCSTEGVANALVSARIAAEVLTQACRAGDASADSLVSYPGQLWREIGDALQMSRRLLTLRTPKAIGSLIRSASRRPHNAGWISGVLIGSALPSEELNDLLSYLNFFNR
ncbi:MAG: geranylgeranyl reductase family protein [Humidesulfovibrio sp.]|uniref:NAD(P)/FAD-dependent oxidoreductase n=1 Tax=Humidesulfovibrio sp. TaxID=2910988 RepID=UPI0027E7AF71|nr:geranylgeranyl reductase family protein [Humidesulfovibrio sp.]MDQ7836752.1 geranylgeranyl reductase family protein [Humidesulfovibrio sp.]